MIANKNEAKTMTKHISCICKCKFNRITCNSNQKWNNKTCQCECENYWTWKKYHSWNPQYKIENNELKKVRIKNLTCYYFYDIIKLKDFDLNNIFIHEKLHKKYFDVWHFI